MERTEEYRILRKALHLVETKTKDEIKSMFNLLTDETIEDMIITDVSVRFGVTVEQMLGSRRKRSYVEARHAAVYLLKKYTNLTYMALAKIFGKKDHATMIHAVRTAESNLFYDDFRLKVEFVEKNLNSVIEQD